MKYLITGGSGFIGRNLVHTLLDQGHEVVVIDLVPFYLKEVTTLIHDISDDKLPVVQADILVHLSAETSVRESMKYPKETIRKNIISTLNCLEYARKWNYGAFIFTSSMGAANIISPYTGSKAACEAVCKSYKESYNMNVQVLRLSNVYGPYSVHKTSVVAKFIKQILTKQPIHVYGDGTQTRDFIYVSDVVKAITEAHNFPYIEITNVSSGSSNSINSLISILKDLSKKYLNYIPDVSSSKFCKGEAKHSVSLTDLDNTKPFREGLEDTIKWFLNYSEATSGN